MPDPSGSDKIASSPPFIIYVITVLAEEIDRESPHFLYNMLLQFENYPFYVVPHVGGKIFDRESPYIWTFYIIHAHCNISFKKKKKLTGSPLTYGLFICSLVPACDQSEHVSSAQSAQHFEERNVVTVHALSITIKSLHLTNL